ncbi:MAG TPA: FHA domain-containing protein [Microbacteriaceae bacterium]|nr:FHA domain-containing protein [Microbacteriaceae bacterium]
MSALTLLVLRIGFLLLLWLFVFAVVYALRSDLFGRRARTLDPASAPRPSGAAPSRPSGGPTTMIAMTPTPAGAAQGVVMKKHQPLATPGASPGTAPAATIGVARNLVITSGPKKGTTLELGREPITIGRARESVLVLRDDYTSTHHARIMVWNDTWMLQDLGSTNGTFLAGTRIGTPTIVPLDTPIKVGMTTFELRR